jgi:hypothetical protein
MSMPTGFFGRNAHRFQTVVAMWIVVGFGGSLLFGSFGLMLVTGTGMFADKAVFNPGLEFPAGQEVKISDGVGPGNFMVLAYPATVEISTVECAWKSQVYSTGEQRSGNLDIARPDGVAEALTAYGATPRDFTAVASTRSSGWMEPDLLTCTGEGVESFAIASAEGIQTDQFRLATGGALLLLAPVMFGLGLLALHFTRKWRRHGMSRQPGARTTYPQPQPYPYPPTHQRYPTTPSVQQQYPAQPPVQQQDPAQPPVQQQDPAQPSVQQPYPTTPSVPQHPTTTHPERNPYAPPS